MHLVHTFSCPQVLDSTSRNSRVAPVVTAENAHVYKLVSEQKRSAPKRRPPPRIGGYPPRYPARPLTSYHAYGRGERYPAVILPVARARPPSRSPLSAAFKEDIYRVLEGFPNVRKRAVIVSSSDMPLIMVLISSNLFLSLEGYAVSRFRGRDETIIEKALRGRIQSRGSTG